MAVVVAAGVDAGVVAVGETAGAVTVVVTVGADVAVPECVPAEQPLRAAAAARRITALVADRRARRAEEVGCALMARLWRAADEGTMRTASCSSGGARRR